MPTRRLPVFVAALAAWLPLAFASAGQAQENTWSEVYPIESKVYLTEVKWEDLAKQANQEDWEEFWQSVTFEQLSDTFIQGTDVNFTDGNGDTPLHWAARWNKTPEIVQLLLDNGAKVDSTDEEGLTPLHVAAAWSTTPKVMQLMLAKVEDVNVRGKHGETPLHAAALYGEMPQTIYLLLEHGADIYAKDRIGRTPLDLASENKNTKAMETILKQYANEFASNDG